MEKRSVHIDLSIKGDKSIEGIFEKGLFWDVDPNRIFLKKNAGFIIDRVLRWSNIPGTLDKLEEIYPIGKIKRHARAHRDIRSNEVFDILSSRYNIPKKDFLYYRSF